MNVKVIRRQFQTAQCVKDYQMKITKQINRTGPKNKIYKCLKPCKVSEYELIQAVTEPWKEKHGMTSMSQSWNQDTCSGQNPFAGPPSELEDHSLESGLEGGSGVPS